MQNLLVKTSLLVGLLWGTWVHATPAPQMPAMEVKSRWEKNVYEPFVLETKGELLIYTPYAKGALALKPLANLRELRGKSLKMEAIVEGPLAIQTKTHLAFENLAIETLGVPITADGHKEFTVSTTYLIRDRKTVLLLGHPLEISPEQTCPNLAIVIHDPEAVANIIKAYELAQSYAIPFPKTEAQGNKLKITTGRTLQERARE